MESARSSRAHRTQLDQSRPENRRCTDFCCFSCHQRKTASHAHSPTDAHRCDPFSHPFDPFDPYFQKLLMPVSCAPARNGNSFEIRITNGSKRIERRRQNSTISLVISREQRHPIFDWKRQGQSVPAGASVANQRNNALQAQRPHRARVRADVSAVSVRVRQIRFCRLIQRS